MEKNDGAMAILASRAYNYLLFQAIFGNDPSEALLETACSEVSRQSLEIYSDDDNSGYAAALAAATEALDALAAGADAEAKSGATGAAGAAKAVPKTEASARLSKLKDEYTRLFIGPGELKAPPWESLYISKKGLLFDQHTLAVRNFYRSQGFLPAEYPRVADDHIALECAFMAQLGDRARDAYDTGDSDTAKAALKASAEFLDAHLLVWVPKYVEKIAVVAGASAMGATAGATTGAKANSGTGFYPKIAKLALEFMLTDREICTEMLAEL